ncbi:hypothetical protein ACFVFS_17250 [Kitasatospora sp. NPDC057692]|uniref:hypothetical protein n=1 Tax=Kitasatospora sp. NPDC057692 TaxID=3346215 RepID=UPI0036B20AC6
MAYQLMVCDLMTDTRLGVLPIGGVTWDDYIGKTGSLSGTIPVPDSATARRIRETALPGRSMLHLYEEDGQLAWSGVLWTRTRQRDARGNYTCAIQAGGLESYFRAHRLLLADLVAAGADQFAIVRQLITYAQAQAGGNLGVEMDPAQMSGVLRDRQYSRHDLPWIGGLVDQLASTQNGFEWRIQVWADSAGVRHRTLRLGYPKLTVGANDGSADLVLSSPGPVGAYALPEDATTMANAWQSRGASTGTDMGSEQVPLMSQVLTAPGDWAAGWPRLDGTSDYSTVETQSVLDEHAAADLARAARPVAVPSVTYTGNQRPPLGSYVRLRLNDTWHYDVLDARYRVIGLKVQPAERPRARTTDLYLEAA